ncbi:MAG: glycine zipper 2TM domain-containing protein [Piscinibacter sp.]|nr:glycine zipper 2TM domain-containing protein [Piscinibacter sp.]
MASALAVASALVLTACGPEDGAEAQTSAATTAAATAPAPAPRPKPPQGQAGTITAVVPLHTTEKPSGAGAVIGGVVGAALGNQVGGGNGRKAATVIGAVGGAVAGNEIEKNRNTTVTGYRIDVRLDNGNTTSVTLGDPAGYTSGQRVRVLNGSIRPA